MQPPVSREFACHTVLLRLENTVYDTKSRTVLCGVAHPPPSMGEAKAE